MAENNISKLDILRRRGLTATGLALISSVALSSCAKDIEAIPEEPISEPTASSTLDPTAIATETAPTPSVESTPAGTMPNEDFSPTRSDSETETNPNIPTNAIDYNELLDEYRSLSVEDIERLVEREDYETITNYRLLLYKQHLSNLAEYIHTEIENGQTTDCLLNETSKETPVRSSAADVIDGRAAFCMVYGQEGIASTQTSNEDGYVPDNRTTLNKEEAKKAAILAKGPALKDPQHRDDLESTFNDIDATEFVYGIDYGDSATSAKIIETGEMELGGKTVKWNRMEFMDANVNDWRTVKIAYYPVENPVIPLESPSEDGAYPGLYDPEIDLAYEEQGNLLYMMNDDGTATPYTFTEYGSTDPERQGVVQMTMPFLVDDRPPQG